MTINTLVALVTAYEKAGRNGPTFARLEILGI